jgi:hypothetical protein
MRNTIAASLMLIILSAAVCIASVDVAKWDAFTLTKSPPQRFDGPFKCGSAAFYFVHHGGPLKVTLQLKSETDSGKLRKALVRFLDADEHYLDWDYQWFPAEGAIDKSWTFAVTDAKPGIYQLRLALSGDFTYDVTTQPDISFGFMPMRTLLWATKPDQFAEAYVYVPPNSETWSVSTYSDTAVVVTERDKELLHLEPGQSKGEILVAEMPSMWQVNLTMGGNAFLKSHGVPFILCPDATTAANIRGSVEFLPDGTQVWHKFQKQAWDYMRRFSPTDLECEAERSFAPKLEELLKEPVRNAGLFPNYGALRHIRFSLESQNLDPDSIWFGSLHRWKQFIEKGPRWDKWCSFPLYTMSHTGLPNNLAAAYAVPARVNPYGGDEHLLNRVILAAFADLLRIHEDDTLKNATAGDADPYASSTGFPANQNYAFPYGLCAGAVSPEIRAVWTEGYRHIIDRYPFYRVSCENQSAHWLNACYALAAVGEVEADYAGIAHDYCRMMCEPDLNHFMKTGYQEEAYGPDCTYQGLTCSEIAQYYAWSNDNAARDGLRIIYDFFNHTVAPEPDGHIWGASNFAHRTQYGWQHPQYGAGLTIMSGVLPEAGLWRHDADPTDQANILRDTEAINNAVNRQYDPEWYTNGRLMGGASGAIYTGSYLRWLGYPDKVDRTGKLPVVRQESFTENINDEFYAVRRPAYYALIYTGHTAPAWVKSRISFKPNQYWPRTGGGLSLFWTPQYGSAICSMNYTAYMNHHVIAEIGDGKVKWPDYWSVNHEWDETAGTLSIRSKLFDLPVSMVRSHTFLAEGVKEELTVIFDQDVAVEALSEQIPLLKNKPGFQMETLGSENNCRGIWVGAESGEGCLIKFDKPVRISFGEDQELKYYSEIQTNAVLNVGLGATHQQGDEVTIGYLLTTCTKAQLAQYQ